MEALRSLKHPCQRMPVLLAKPPVTSWHQQQRVGAWLPASLSPLALQMRAGLLACPPARLQTSSGCGALGLGRPLARGCWWTERWQRWQVCVCVCGGGGVGWFMASCSWGRGTGVLPRHAGGFWQSQ